MMPYSISPSNSSVNEDAGSIVFTVTRTSGSIAETVNFSTIQNQGYLNSGDYVGRLNSTLNFGVGVTSLNISVGIIDDSIVEGSETFGVLLDTLSGAALSTAKFTILDNDAPVQSAFSISPANSNVNENAGFIDFTISRTNNAQAETAYFSTTKNQGFDNVGDYNGVVDQAVSFSAGVSQKTVRVTILDDTIAETSETFGAIVQNSSFVTMGSATFTILDNDTTPASTYSMTPVAATVGESAGTLAFTITRSSSAQADTVLFSTLKNQGFVNNGDYTGIVDQGVTFGIGETVKTVNVSITDDDVKEGNETFAARIERSGSQQLAQSTFTIIDNDTVGTSRGVAITGGDIVTYAAKHKGELWGRSNCTGFVYSVATESGNEFFDHRASSRVQVGRFGSSNSVLLNNYGANEYDFFVPIRNISNGAAAHPADAFSDPRNPDYQWQLEGSGPNGGNVTATSFRGFQPGDLFRGRVIGNNGTEVMHSGVVSFYDQSANKLTLIDNFISGVSSAAIGYTDFIVDPNASSRHIGTQFAIYRLKSSGSSTNHAVYGSDEDDVFGGGDVADTIVGYAGADSLTGKSGDDILIGDSGSDTLAGDEGSDVLVLGDGDDSAKTGDNIGVDYVYGGAGGDLITGGAGSSDVLLGEGGNDTIYGDAGDRNYIYGGAGSNLIYGGAVTDIFISEGDSDTVFGGGSQNLVYRYGNGSVSFNGSAGVDQFIGGAAQSNDVVNASAGNDYLYGGNGNDLLRGEAGNDVIIGQNGNDTLEGGAGINLLWANDVGSDQILVNIADSGTQVVEFFEAGGTNDVVRILGSSLTGFAGFENLKANIASAVGGNLLINAGSGAQLYLNLGANQTAIWFQGVSAYSLTSADFLFS
jgi:hypothetical protein